MLLSKPPTQNLFWGPLTTTSSTAIWILAHRVMLRRLGDFCHFWPDYFWPFRDVVLNIFVFSRLLRQIQVWVKLFVFFFCVYCTTISRSVPTDKEQKGPLGFVFWLYLPEAGNIKNQEGSLRLAWPKDHRRGYQVIWCDVALFSVCLICLMLYCYSILFAIIFFVILST